MSKHTQADIIVICFEVRSIVVASGLWPTNRKLACVAVEAHTLYIGIDIYLPIRVGAAKIGIFQIHLQLLKIYSYKQNKRR